MRRPGAPLHNTLLLVAGLGGAGLARAAGDLGSYNVDPAGITVAGISSGGFMAVQMHVAFSSQFRGAAIFAGGPFYCAQDSLNNATGYCESGTGLPLQALITYTNNQASAGTIDPTSNLSGQSVYLFSGTNDTTVHQAVMNALQGYYATYLPSGNIVYDNGTAAAHAWISPDGPNGCDTSYSPYINNCNFDPEGTFLAQFYGALNAKNTGTLGGSYIQFNQDPFCPGGSCAGISMDSTGWVFVPQSCASGGTCRVMLVLHGCLQYQGIVNQALVQKSGVNEWADTNDLIVLYPQTIASSNPSNPEGCWDWWGYTGAGYALQSGPQMQALIAMIRHLEGGLPDGGNGTPSDAGPGGSDAGACVSLGYACAGAAVCCSGSSCQSGFCLPATTLGDGGTCTSLGNACSTSAECCPGTTLAVTCQFGFCLPSVSTTDAGSSTGVDAGGTGTDAGGPAADAGACTAYAGACTSASTCCGPMECRFGFCLQPASASDGGSSVDGGGNGTDAGIAADAGAASRASGCGCGSSGGAALTLALLALRPFRSRRAGRSRRLRGRRKQAPRGTDERGHVDRGGAERARDVVGCLLRPVLPQGTEESAGLGILPPGAAEVARQVRFELRG